MMTIIKYICFGLFWIIIIGSFTLTSWFLCLIIKGLKNDIHSNSGIHCGHPNCFNKCLFCNAINNNDYVQKRG